jgi:CDP-glycerol glycerophosphotransferase
MIPKYGMYGAAFSFLIAKIIVVSIVVYISKSYDDIGYRLWEMLKIIIGCLLFMCMGHYFSYTKYTNVLSLFNFIYKIMVIFIYLVYLYITNIKFVNRIFENREVQNLLYKNNFVLKIENLKSRYISFCIKTYMFLINRIFKVKKNKVVFKSFGGKYYSDNPKSISEKLNFMYPEYEIVWLINDPVSKINVIPYYVRVVKSKSFKALMELSTAKVWVDNFCKTYAYKSKEQIYIQTWHGDRGFKKILLDSPFITENFKLFESENCDLTICGSNFGESKYKTAFGYNGEILKMGCPRNDLLVKHSESKKFIIKSNLNLLYNTKILLYAPTLRRDAENKFQSSKDLDLFSIINSLQSKTKCSWICMVRAHSAVKGISGIPKNFKKIIDVTHYEDMADLLLISDFLITDYSSCAGDFALLNKPIILFQPDREEYVQNDRTFYFDIDSSPFMIAKDNEEILKLIMNFDQEIIQKNCKDILNFYGAIESGEASERVVEYIISKIK